MNQKQLFFMTLAVFVTTVILVGYDVLRNKNKAENSTEAISFQEAPALKINAKLVELLQNKKE